MASRKTRTLASVALEDRDRHALEDVTKSASFNNAVEAVRKRRRVNVAVGRQLYNSFMLFMTKPPRKSRRILLPINTDDEALTVKHRGKTVVPIMREDPCPKKWIAYRSRIKDSDLAFVAKAARLGPEWRNSIRIYLLTERFELAELKNQVFRGLTVFPPMTGRALSALLKDDDSSAVWIRTHKATTREDLANASALLNLYQRELPGRSRTRIRPREARGIIATAKRRAGLTSVEVMHEMPENFKSPEAVRQESYRRRSRRK